VKLVQKEVNNISVLILQDEISDRDVQVLGAGIKKLMMSGKNRIIVELTGVSAMSSGAIRAIGQLDLAARELAGRVLTCGASAPVMKQIEAFATPPIVALFKDLKTAVLEFQKTKAVDEAQKAGAAPTAPAPVHGAKPASAPVPGKEPARPSDKAGTAAAAGPKDGLSREEIMEREKAEVTNLRKSITDLEAQNRILMEQITEMTFKRKDMPTEAAYREKVTVLEGEIAELTKQLNSAPAAKP